MIDAGGKTIMTGLVDMHGHIDDCRCHRDGQRVIWVGGSTFGGNENNTGADGKARVLLGENVKAR